MFFISTFEQSFVFSVRQVNKSHHRFLSWIRIRSEKTAGSVSTLSKTAGPDPSPPIKKMRINSPCWRLPASNNIFFFFFLSPVTIYFIIVTCIPCVQRFGGELEEESLSDSLSSLALAASSWLEEQQADMAARVATSYREQLAQVCPAFLYLGIVI